MLARYTPARFDAVPLIKPLVTSAVGRIACVCVYVWLLMVSMPLAGQKKINAGVLVRELALHKEILCLLEDHDGFIWAGTNAGLYRFDGREFVLFSADTAGAKMDGSHLIRSIAEDPLGRIWVSTLVDVFILSRDRRSMMPLSLILPGHQGVKNVNRIVMVGHEAWLFNHSPSITCCRWNDEGVIRESRNIHTPSDATANVTVQQDGSYLVELYTRKEYLHVSADGQHIVRKTAPSENSIFIHDTMANTLYAVGPPFLFTYDEHVKTFKPRLSFAEALVKPIPCWAVLSRTSAGNIWIGSRLGHVLYYTRASNEYLDITDVLTNRLFDGRFFSSNVAIEDMHGGLWLGTNLGLVYIKLQDAQYFQTLVLPQTESTRQSFSTRGITKDKNGDLWVSSYAGLFRYRNGKPVKKYLIWNDLLGSNVDPVVYSFLPDKDHILMLSEGNSVLQYEYDTDSVYRWFPSSFFDQTKDKEVKALQWGFEIYKDRSGVIWMGMMAGLFRMSANGEIVRAPELSGLGREAGQVFDIVEDDSRVLWVATASGLWSVNTDRNTVVHHSLEKTEQPKTQCLLLDRSTWLWIGTKGNGLYRYHLASGTITRFTTEHGLPDNTVCNILTSDDKRVWITTNQGMSRYDPQLDLFTNFYMEDGLPENEFNQASAFKDTDGTLYFGSVNGVVTFHPNENPLARPASDLRITRIHVHDGKAGTTINYLYNSYLSPSVHLDFTDKYFTVFFSQNDPTPYTKVNHAYRLSGLDDRWQVIGEQNNIQFTGLQPGHYTLQIKTLHRQAGDAAMVEVPIFIARPFYSRWYAYVMYIIAIGLITFLIIREYFKRQHINRQLQLELDHALRLQEINRTKSTFFTNITHEFKTPLTLIQGPAEEITRRTKDPHVGKLAGLISKSAKSILALVNQLLELGKLEANLEELQFHRLDIVSHVRKWAEAFESLARQKNIQLHLEMSPPSLYVDFDPVKFETVINNLMSNALKFTPENGMVTCKITTGENDRVWISVSDNGPGIPEEEQEHVFDRFYQGKNSVLGGTGIGLAFVREMVRMHDGNVTLHSIPGKGATFIVNIPMAQEGAVTLHSNSFHTSDDPQAPDAREEDSPHGSTDQPVVLVVEDHEDVADLIMECLRMDYRVIHAPNGRDGHKAALNEIPDLVITDLMMPVMDGYSLTHLLKSAPNTCHIPVIMLTAKDGVASRIEGRSSGADIYLEKPFSPKELQLTVRNLFALRAAVINKARQQIMKNATEVRFEYSADDQFYQSFLQVLETHLSDATLSVDDFTRHLGISRTQLHRKLKALTGFSVNQIVRNVRLQKGMGLLRQGQLNVGEVAYEVGFNSPAYFAERFKEYYGHSPSEVEKADIA